MRELVAITGCLALVAALGCTNKPTSTAQTNTTTGAAPSFAPSEGQPQGETEVVATQPAVEEQPPADEPTPKVDGEPVEISFDDLNIQLQADVVFRPWMLSDRVKELEGQRVRIAGYMLPGSKLENIDHFVLLRNTECKFGPGGKADHLLMAMLREGDTTIYRNKPIEIEGTLTVNPFQGEDGNTWNIYDLNDVTAIKVVRR